MIGIPLFMAILETTHPVHLKPTGVYRALSSHVDWWIFLHVIQLVLFGLLGLAVYWLVSGIRGLAATVARISVLCFVIFYNAFDALVGLGNGILIKYTQGTAPEQREVLEKAIDAFWTSGIATLITALAVTSWLIAVFAAMIARAEAESKRWLVLLGVVAVPFGLFSFPAGISGTLVWWICVVGLGVVFALLAKPRLSTGLLTVAALLFASSHTPPWGPPGLFCFFLATLLVELNLEKQFAFRVQLARKSRA
ncbi:hypothetical protein SAMN05444955_10353 [Lihuaxuella thermophila]|uniref:Uncharacterized protein n=2 Tax=Lihuaxuella thermophila TaxID=1173111 RepID=A0A1H8C4G4_9BACL|nr:hypothetical protein SAMN05444955_10353 [Lihuaxuella thermophila]